MEGVERSSSSTVITDPAGDGAGDGDVSSLHVGETEGVGTSLSLKIVGAYEGIIDGELVDDDG